MPNQELKSKPADSEEPSDEWLSSSALFSDFRRMLKDAYWQSQCPSVDVQTRYLVRLSLTEEQNELWDKVMNPKENTYSRNGGDDNSTS